MYNAREVTEAEAPVLYGVTHDLALRMNMPMPKVYIIPSEAPNAFATGRNPNHAAVAATEGILRLLSRDELTGVMAHELSHVRNRDVLIGTVAAAFAGAITMLASMARWGMIFGGYGGGRDDDNNNPFAALLLVLLAPLAAGMIQLAISRSREYGADETGARIIGNPDALASALEKLEMASTGRPLQVNPAVAHMFIVNPLKGVNFSGLFSTHPPLEERVRRLRAMQLARIN